MKAHRLARVLVLLAAFTGAAPGLASAAPPDQAAAAPGAGDPAAQLMAAGNRAFKEGKFAAAEEAYRAAFAVNEGYDIAGNLGAAELAQGKLREAAQHLAFTLRLLPRHRQSRGPRADEEGLRAVPPGRGRPAGDARSEGRGGQRRRGGGGEAPLLDEDLVDPGDHVIEAQLAGYAGAPDA